MVSDVLSVPGAQSALTVDACSVMSGTEHGDRLLDQHGSDRSHQIETRVGGPPGRDQCRSDADMDQSHPHADDGDKDQIDYDVSKQQIQEGSFLRIADTP